MSVQVAVRYNPASFERLRQRLSRELAERQIAEVAGRAGVNVVQDHLRGLDDARKNRLGGRRSHFYSAAAAATHYRITQANNAAVVVSHTGMAQRYYGGTIRPSGRISAKTGKPIRALAIPARAAAYGVAPSEIEGLFVRPGRSGRTAALVRREGGALRVYFWLVKSVTQKGDKTVLPGETPLRAAIRKALESYADRIDARRAG